MTEKKQLVTTTEFVRQSEITRQTKIWMMYTFFTKPKHYN